MQLNLVLHPYQERAIREAVERKRNFEAIDMGLGKTRVMLEVCKKLNRKALVLAPLRVALHTWPAEINKWMPEFNYAILHGTDKNDLWRSTAAFKIINYDGLKWLGEMVAKHGSGPIKGRVLIIDESTQIKNPSSIRFKVLKKLLHLFPYVFCLSGTLLPNGYKNLWSQYYTLDGGRALGLSDYVFKRNYFYESGPPRWITQLREGAAEDIQSKVKPITTVLFADDYLKMPEAIYEDIEVDLGIKNMELYKKLEDEYILKIGDNVVSSVTAAVNSMKLRQFTQGCLYTDSEGNYERIHEAKVQALADFVSSADGDPILCPIQFKFELAEIRRFLGYDVPAVVGGMRIKEQMQLLDAWNRGELPLLLCHPAALSHGLNLQQGGRIVCWYSLTWDLEQYRQLNGRLLRQGQTKPVYIAHIVAKGTKDKKVAEAIKAKEITQDDFLRAIHSA